MKAILAHDHKYRKYNNEYYSPGGLSDEVLQRYNKTSSNITVIARVLDIKTSEKTMSKITNNCTKILGIKSLLGIWKKENQSLIQKEINSSDVVIARLPSIIGFIAIKNAIKENKPYLIELVGCPWDAFWNHSWKGKLIAPFMWYTTKKAVKNAPYVLYVTNEFLQHRYPTTGRTIGCSDVALPTIDESVLAERLHKIEQMTKYKSIVIGTIAAVDVRYKGQEYVIQAIAELNKQGYNFEYRLVGGGDKARLQSIAEKHGVADKVIFEGSVPHKKVFDYLDSIDIYVQPSQTEGLPRALIEAMSRGCHCIGSNVGGIPELLDQEYIFKKGNTSSLVKILSRVDKEKLSKQANRNYRLAKNYSEDILNTRRNIFLQEFKKNTTTNGRVK